MLEPAMRANSAGLEATARPSATPPARPAAKAAVRPAVMARTLPVPAAVDPPQLVGEPPRDARRRDAAFDLPQRHDDELARVAVAAADEDQRAVEEVADVDRAARRARADPRRTILRQAAGRHGARDAPGDLRARVDLAAATADALAE